jgi:hypothetical protein
LLVGVGVVEKLILLALAVEVVLVDCFKRLVLLLRLALLLL